MIHRMNARVSKAYRLNGMVFKNRVKPLMPASSGRDEVTAAAQLEMGAMMQTGAAVASMI